MSEAAPVAAPAPATPEGTSSDVGGGAMTSSVTAPKPPKVVKPKAKVVIPRSNGAAAEPVQAEGAEPDAGESEEAAEPELYEVQVDGRKEQWTREKLVAEAQKSSAAQKRFREAAELTKKNQAILEMLDKDPIAVLKERKADIRKLATEFLSQQAEDAMLSPEEREFRDIRAERDSLKAEKEQSAAKAQQAEQAKAYEAVTEQLDKSFTEAAQRAGLEQHPNTLEMMVEVAMEAVELGLTLSADQVAAEAKDRLEGLVSKRDAKIASGLTGEKLLSYLGAKTVEQVLLASRAKLRGLPAYQAKPAAAPPEPKREASTVISPADWQAKYMR